MKKIFLMITLASMMTVSMAQSGTNSPYSQFGLGVLSDQSPSFNRGMNGLGIAFREHNHLNNLNPASYSAIDSLSFVFDAGVSGQIANFKEGDKKINARNGDFDYVVAGFRLAPKFGISFGLLPYTNVGYNYNVSNYVDESKQTKYLTQYYGEGGLHEAYVGLGYEFLKGLSLGVNAGYLWGRYYRYATSSFSSESSLKVPMKSYSAEVHSYKLTFGAQYVRPINKLDELTVGATVTLGHDVGGDPTCDLISTNSSTGVSDTTHFGGSNLHLEIPMVVGLGVGYKYHNQLKVGLDWTMQNWAKVSSPQFVESANGGQYVMKDNAYKNRHKFVLGADYCANEMSRSFLSRMHYRCGIGYATPYLKINGQDGPKEYSATVGLGIPIINSYNNRSILNISAQWIRQDSKTFITENTFRINVGLTFNERWFAKWKVE